MVGIVGLAGGQQGVFCHILNIDVQGRHDVIARFRLYLCQVIHRDIHISGHPDHQLFAFFAFQHIVHTSFQSHGQRPFAGISDGPLGQYFKWALAAVLLFHDEAALIAALAEDGETLDQQRFCIGQVLCDGYISNAPGIIGCFSQAEQPVAVCAGCVLLIHISREQPGEAVEGHRIERVIDQALCFGIPVYIKERQRSSQ